MRKNITNKNTSGHGKRKYEKLIKNKVGYFSEEARNNGAHRTTKNQHKHTIVIPNSI